MVAGWEDNSCWGGNDFVAAQHVSDSAIRHCGQCSQRVTVTGGIVQVVQPLALESGVRYDVPRWL